MHASTTFTARCTLRTPMARAAALALLLVASAVTPAKAATAPAADLVVSAAALKPFATYSGLPSDPQSVTVTNTSTKGLTGISASALSNAGLWHFTSRCPTELKPAESCDIDIRLSPPIGTTAVGLVTAMRAIAAGALPSEAFEAGGRVEFPIASPSPAQLAFSAVAGATSPFTAVTFTLSAGGAGPVALVFPPSAPVRLGTDECSGKSFQQGQSCQVFVAFAPPAGSGGTSYNSSVSFQVDANLGDSRSRTTIGIVGVSGTSLASAALTVATTGTGTGLVVSNPTGIDCGSTCSAEFALGSSVTLNTDPSGASVFAGWSGGGCSGTGLCTVTMDAAKSVTARFESTARTLTVAKTGTGSGLIVSNPVGINCGTTCSADFAPGSTVTLNTDPSGASAFAGWSGGGCSGTGTCTVTTDAAKLVTARFDSLARTLTVAKTGTGTGVVVSNPAGINCGPACSADFTAGSTVTLNTDPAGDSVFAGWSGGGCSGTGLCTVTMDAAKSVTAIFDSSPTRTVVSTAGNGSLPEILSKLNGACPAGPTLIRFDIPVKTDPGCDASTGICFLDVPGDLEVRCSNVTIDGYTQPGASPNTDPDHGNNAAIRVELRSIEPAKPRFLRVQGEASATGFLAIKQVTIRGLALPHHQLLFAPGFDGGKPLGGGGHVVTGNLFGWHADGRIANEAAIAGIRLLGAPIAGVQIGGPKPGERNRLSWRNRQECCEPGLFAIDAQGLSGALIEGNYINVDEKGFARPSTGVLRGISLDGDPAAGIPPSRKNVIARNAIAGTSDHPVFTGSGGGNTVSENVIVDQKEGVAGTSFVPATAGGENAQLAPTLTQVRIATDAVRVSGTASGTPSGSTRLEFFHNDVAEKAGAGRAEEFVAHLDVPLDTKGNGAFEATLPGFVRNVAVTATRLETGDTSMFADTRGVPVIEADTTPPIAVIDAPANGRIGEPITVSAARSSDVGGRIATYAFTIGLDPPFVVVGPIISLTPTTLGPINLRLVVTDDSGNASSPVTATIIVRDTDAPTAVLDAPTGTLLAGRPLTLLGTRSFDTGGGRVVSYRWSALERPAGSTALASPVNTRDPRFTFTPDKGGTWRVQLIVGDDAGNDSSPVTVTLTVIEPDVTAPIAVIDAPATGRIGEPITISAARSSDVGGRIATYAFTIGLDPPFVVVGPIISLTPTTLGPINLRLVVTDDSGNASSPVTATIIVRDTDAPTAVIDAPTGTLLAGRPLALSASRSTDTGGGRVVSYRWSAIERPTGSTALASPVNTRDPRFTFTPDKAGTWRVQLIVGDDAGNDSSPVTVTLTVIEPDVTAPIAVIDAPATGRIGEPITISAARSSDVGGRIATYAFTIGLDPPFVVVGPIISLTPTTLGPINLRLVVTDDSGNVSSPASATIIVRDTDAPTAVLDAPTGTLLAGRPLTLLGTRSFDTGGGRVVSYRWSALERPAGSTALASPVNTRDPRFTFTPDKGGTWRVQLIVGDDAGNDSSPVTVTLTVIEPDVTAPIAVIDAPATGRIGEPITISAARSSDVGGRIVRYTWSGTGLASPVDTATPSLSFTPDRFGVFTFQLVVTDDSGNVSSPASTTIIVRDTDAPTAVIDTPTGTLLAGRPLMLLGTRSFDTGGGRVVTYKWSAIARPAGSTAFASPVSTNDARLTFTPDKGGTWRVQLVVVDDAGNESSPVTAAFTVIETDTTAPIAVIDAPATGRIGAPLTLSGSRSSDVGGRIVRYAWSGAGLASPVDTATPSLSFTPDRFGVFTFQLVVTDDSGNVSSPASATIIVRDTDAPTAVIDTPAGTLLAGRPLVLSGNRSFDTGGGRVVVYRWIAVERPAGSTAFASPVDTSDPRFAFTPDKGGTWRVQLVVGDDAGNDSSPVSATFTVIEPDTTAPIAVIDAPASGRIGAPLTLSGSRSSDVGGRIVSYTWSAMQRPAGSTVFTSPFVTDAPSLSFTPDRAGRWSFSLAVTDDSGNTSAPAVDSLVVLPITTPESPVAALDAPKLVETGTPVKLDGSSSKDGDGRIVRYQWSAVLKPKGSHVFDAPVATGESTFSFTPDSPGLYLVQLVVVDESGMVSRPATVAIIALKRSVRGR